MAAKRGNYKSVRLYERQKLQKKDVSFYRENTLKDVKFKKMLPRRNQLLEATCLKLFLGSIQVDTSSKSRLTYFYVGFIQTTGGDADATDRTRRNRTK